MRRREYVQNIGNILHFFGIKSEIYHWSHPQSSVHDDLEQLIRHIEVGNVIVPLGHELFLHKMLTRKELQKI